MALTEDQQTTTDGVFLLVCFMAFVMMTTYLFAGYIVWAHEQTAQDCIHSGRIWQSDSCLLYRN